MNNSFCRYIGETKFAPGEWAGVELDESQGNLFIAYDACESVMLSKNFS
jgi:hypothetical protein